MVSGVKSKKFGCYWKSMFLTAMCYPMKLSDSKEDQLTKKRYKAWYDSFEFILPCKFCREFIRDHLSKKHPLQFTGRIELMQSIYTWKDQVNKKLIAQGHKISPSPSFECIYNKYERIYRANSCVKKMGICK
jgi:hypothetical protein